MIEETLDVNQNKSKLIKRRNFVVQEENVNDPLPGIGLSVPGAQKAVKIVSNRVFSRQFKIAKEGDGDSNLDAIDLDTLPNERSIRKMAEQVETHGLAAEAHEILAKSSEGGNVFTHAADSTTKKGVGKFNVSGIHINRDELLPLRTIPVAGKSKQKNCTR